jgi:hypothetical protein
MVTGESNEWTDDAHGALHTLSAAERYGILLYGSRRGCYTINSEDNSILR